MMKNHIAVVLLLLSGSVQAGFLDYFKNESGGTKWQYVANFSSAVLILLLSITVVIMLVRHQAARRANRELNDIRKSLEDRVAERTTTLACANEKLEAEVAEHLDTTARLKGSEAYIKSILDSMPLMLVGLNEDLEITQWNSWAEKITGANWAQVLGKNLWEAYPTITLTQEQVQEVMDTKKTLTIKHSQRSQYYFDITLYALQGNRETGIVILLDDVTKRVKAENRLIELDKMASMGELAATMAQDVGTPLHAIVKHLNAIHSSVDQADEIPDSMRGLYDELVLATDSSKQALAIVSNLLEFSSHQGAALQQADLSEVIDHTLELANKILITPTGLQFKNIKIERNYQDDLVKIPCQVAELQQVFLGIFRHACFALGSCKREGFTPVVKINIDRFYDSIWVKIHHNGLGLTSEEQQDIFEPFFLNENGEAQGLGSQRLSYPYFVVTEHHNGHMAVTSDVDVGTTFHIQLQVV
ncbi:two-component system sensor histidine kinase NtrB [Teredinibacter waterburyi]|uniref:two-component system sensor histidine kinase NtrB n=1 Tax=Teredinibacter waterburyi TaxID=1500538 RepID=UPI001FEB8A16|nr:PAS domain S-box protein [Teredinibacter waterburyi]